MTRSGAEAAREGEEEREREEDEARAGERQGTAGDDVVESVGEGEEGDLASAQGEHGARDEHQRHVGEKQPLDGDGDPRDEPGRGGVPRRRVAGAEAALARLLAEDVRERLRRDRAARDRREGREAEQERNGPVRRE